MAKPIPTKSDGKPSDKAITKNDYLSLAAFLLGGDSPQRMMKRDPSGEAVKAAAELYGNREYVPAYEGFKPVYEKVVSDMQRVLARNIEFEANKLAQRQHVAIAVAKDRVQNIRTHAQQVIDQFDRLLRDLESKPLVRAFIKKNGNAIAAAPPPVEEPPPTVLASTSETWVESPPAAPVDAAPAKIEIEGRLYLKAPYAPPEHGSLYLVRDKAKGDRTIRVIAIDPDGGQLQVEVLKEGKVSKQPIQLAVDSLARQAAKGWCSLLVPVAEQTKTPDTPAPVASSHADSHFRHISMRLDSQNFSRCCADIVRANLKFDTQAIKDVQDGPFRAGKYEQAFLIFEQIAVQFNSSVSNSRREISEGRRLLSTQKFKLSGKEVLERMAAFLRQEHLIQTAEREFSTILEGLRMYLRVLAASENQAEA